MVVRAHGAQVVHVGRKLFIDESPVARDVNAAIAFVRGIEFVIVEEGVERVGG